MPFHGHSTIDRPPEVAFDLMADARNEPSWNSQVSSAELTSAGPIGLGTTFTTVNRGRSYDATISAYDPPHLLAFHVTGGGLDITTTFRFTAEGTGTALDSEFDFRPKGVLKLVFPLLARSIRTDVPRQAANFTAFCERFEPEP